MTHILFTGFLVLIILIGALLFLALAGTAIIYCLGSNQSPKGRRIFFGILGVVMIYAFICFCVFIAKNGWPL